MPQKDTKGNEAISHTSSPGVMSPASPATFDGPSSGGASFGPRLRTLEAQAAVQATELALLRQLGDDMGSWRYRVDSASAQTAHVLQALNTDLDNLKLKVSLLGTEGETPSRGVIEDLATQMRSCYQDLQGSLSRLQGDKAAAAAALTDASVQSRLDDVERQLSAAQSLLTAQGNVNSAFNVTAADLRASVAEAAALAEGAATEAMTAGQEAEAAVQAAAAAAGDAAALSNQVQELRLGLEVVEAALEDLDDTDALFALRSRMDDLDAGIERSAEEAMSSIAEVQGTLEDLRSVAERADRAAAAADAKATAAIEAAAAAGHGVAILRMEMHEQAAVAAASRSVATPSASTPASPSSSMAGSSDPRLKAAVHTLSDGYRSLHRAMSLMYEEQAEVAVRVSAVGAAAVAVKSANPKGSMASRIKRLNARVPQTLASHPVPLSPRSNTANNATPHTTTTTRSSSGGVVIDAGELSELRVLLAAQAAETAQQARRAEALEDEVREMRRLLCGLAPAVVASKKERPAPVQETIPEEEQGDETVFQESPEETHKVDEVVEESWNMQMLCDEAVGKVSVCLVPAGNNVKARPVLGNVTNKGGAPTQGSAVQPAGKRFVMDQEQVVIS